MFPLDRFILSPGNRLDLDIIIPVDTAGNTFNPEDRLPREPIVLSRIVVDNAPPISTPDFEPPVRPDFIPARLFHAVMVSKTWYLNAVRGGDFGIGWTMNRRLWPDADTAGFKLGEPAKVQFGDDGDGNADALLSGRLSW